MSLLTKGIKKILLSKHAPNFLYSVYFEKTSQKKRQWLSTMLQQKENLVQQLNEQKRNYWQSRIDHVLSSPDNESIERVKNAGSVVDNHFIMHNGIKVDPMSYYSYPLLQMLIDNKGVHEPQEEKIFQEVLKFLPKGSKKTMLELGAYWSFYSMWFLQKFPSAQCYMVEPKKENLFYGKRNFQLNEMNGTFIHAGIGKTVSKKNNILTVDEICRKNRIKFLDILHSDIQGYELEMLQGSKKIFSENRIGYVFISTHSNELHEQCYDFLKNKYGFNLVASANLDESFSWDGILVMKAPNYKGVAHVDIFKK